MDYLEVQHENIKNYKSIKNCVYKFISPSGKSYIGISKNFYSRYLGHKREATREQKDCSKKFYNACKKYNFYNFKIYILKQDIEDDELLKLTEVLYIDKYKTQDSNYGYNMTPGGDGAQLFGEHNGMYGKNHTLESIQKMKDNRAPMFGSDNAWHSSNRTEEELKERGQKALQARLLNISNMTDEEKEELSKSLSAQSKTIWKNIENNNMQKSLDALRYWEYKSAEELEIINKKKSLPKELNGRAQMYVLISPLGEKYEVCLTENLKLFCEEHKLVFRALQVCINKDIVKHPVKGDSKFHSDKVYAEKRLNTIGWKITKYRRREYEILSR